MILLDDRVGSAELKPILTTFAVDVELDRLPSGDAMFVGNGPTGTVTIGVERKRLMDCIQSLQSGRFAGLQLPEMMQHFDYAYMVVEGLFRAEPDTGALERWHGGRWTAIPRGRLGYWQYDDLDGWLASIQNMCNVKVRITPTPKETCRFLANQYRWWDRPWDDHKSLNVIYMPPPPVVGLFEPPLIRKVAALLDGIGWKKSEAVANHFASVADMVNADQREWSKIDGIGPKIAAKAIRLLNGD